MVKTELELAIRVTVDLGKAPTPVERGMLQRALTLAKEIQVLRGVVDPSLALVERHLEETAALTPGPEWQGLTPLEVAERDAIIQAAQGASSFINLARILGIARPTLRNKMNRYSIPNEFSRKGVV